MTQITLEQIDPPDRVIVAHMTLAERVAMAVELLRANVPPEGYYVADSYGKDSCAIVKLCELSGVKHDCWYNNTTIDAPELIHFGKKNHPHTKWNNPPISMMKMMAEDCSSPPTRWSRWCCEVYKEGGGGTDRTRVMGVRAAESPARKRNWSEVVGINRRQYPMAIAPIVYWTNNQLWEFIIEYNIPVCELYAEGWKRLGCIGCPLAGCEHQAREFERWPAYERNWRRAIVANWEKWHAVPLQKPRKVKIGYDDAGKPIYTENTIRYQGYFKSGEQMYEWWRTMKSPREVDGGCISELLWTNAPDLDESAEGVVT